MDPIVRVIIRLALAILFLDAFCHKSSDVAAFRGIVGQYRILPRRLLSAFAMTIVAVELLVAVSLPVVQFAFPGFAAAALLALYALALAINLVRGRVHIDCGCHGPARRDMPLGWYLVWRNLALAAAALLSAGSVVARPLYWLDYCLVPFSVAILVLLYQSVELARDHRYRVQRHRMRHMTQGVEVN